MSNEALQAVIPQTALKTPEQKREENQTQEQEEAEHEERGGGTGDTCVDIQYHTGAGLREDVSYYYAVLINAT